MAIPEAGQNGASPLRDAMRRHEVLAAGIVSGVAGGIVMMAVAMIAAAMQNVPPLHPLRIIGESFVGPEALDGVARVALGTLLHLLTSAALGIVFAAMAPREFRTTCAMGLGVGIALFAMGFMMSAIVPSVNPGLRGAFQAIGGSWVVAQGVFGATLGFAPALRRWMCPETSDADSRQALVRPLGAEIASPTRVT